MVCTKTPPEIRGRFGSRAPRRCGAARPGRSGGLVLDDLRRLARSGTDLDRARLHRLGHLADEGDMPHAVVDAGPAALPVAGPSGAPPEGAPCCSPRPLAALS